MLKTVVRKDRQLVNWDRSVLAAFDQSPETPARKTFIVSATAASARVVAAREEDVEEEEEEDEDER